MPSLSPCAVREPGRRGVLFPPWDVEPGGSQVGLYPEPAPGALLSAGAVWPTLLPLKAEPAQGATGQEVVCQSGLASETR